MFESYNKTHPTSLSWLSAVKNRGCTYVQAPWFLCSSCTQNKSALLYILLCSLTKSNGKGDI